MRLRRGAAAWRCELRLLGPGRFVLPVLVVAGLGGLAGVLDWRQVDRRFLAQFVTAILEACLPLAAGVTVASMTAHDPAVELLLALPSPYRHIAFRRLALVLGWTACVGLAATLTLQVVFPWALPQPAGAAQLIWLGPLLCCAGAAGLLALILHNGAAGGAVLGGLWVAQLAFHDYFALTAWTQPWFLFATLVGSYPVALAFWTTNRLDLIVVAAGLFLATWGYLRNTEWRLRGEEG